MTSVSSIPAGSARSISRSRSGLPAAHSGSRTSASITVVVPSAASSAPACAATIGSLSTYTTRRSRVDLVHRLVGVVLRGQARPMSMNCRMPWRAIHTAARPWNPRLAHIASTMSGTADLEPLRRLPVDREVVRAAQEVVVQPGRARPGRVHARGNVWERGHPRLRPPITKSGMIVERTSQGQQPRCSGACGATRRRHRGGSKPGDGRRPRRRPGGWRTRSPGRRR